MSHFECHLNWCFWRSKKLYKLSKLGGGAGGRKFGQNPKEQQLFFGMSSLNDSTLWVFTIVEKLSFSQVKEGWIMRRAILQRFVNLLVARMLADEHPDSSLRHHGIREEKLLLQVKVEVLKEMLETSRKCRRRTHILSSILSWWWGAGCPQDRILQLT